MYLQPKCEEIQKRREELGISRQKLSIMAGLGKYAITRMEKGIHKVHYLRAKQVAEILQCDIEDLFEV